MTEITLAELRLVPSTLVACTTLLIYDHLCTLDQEVSRVWSYPLKGGSILFILNRYLPYVDTLMSLNLSVLSAHGPESCLKQYSVLTWFLVSGIIISEIIIVIRTYVLWGRRRLILGILCCSTSLTIIPGIVITHFEIRSLQYVPSPYPSKPGCTLGHASPIILIAYILLVLSETTVAVLTGIQSYRSLRHSTSPWIKQMYKNGLLFYLYLLTISIANVLVPVFGPGPLANWLATPQRVLHSILCNRVLLQILRRPSEYLVSPVSAAAPGQDQSIFMFTSSVGNEEVNTSIAFVPPSDISHVVSSSSRC